MSLIGFRVTPALSRGLVSHGIRATIVVASVEFFIGGGAGGICHLFCVLFLHV